MENPFLKKKYGDLQVQPDVIRVSERKARLTEEKPTQQPLERIQNYLDRFTEVIERKDPDERRRGLEAIKRLLRTNAVIRPSDVPESAFLLEQRIARELGHGTIEITDEFREKKTAQIIADQTSSLDKWVDYLASSDAQYPDWAKYWAIRSVVEMGKFEKSEDEGTGRESAVFKKRTKETVAPFPPLNPRALAMTFGALRSKLDEDAKPKSERRLITNQSSKLPDAEFRSLVATESFPRIYAQFLIEMPEYSTEGLQETRGKWVTYPRGADPSTLVRSLEGHPLEWCIANPDTARDYLQGGDLSVYYSLDLNGDPAIPRAAIRMQGDAIAEVRGIAPDQNLDPFIGDVVQKKMHEFPDGKAYEKKAADMKYLTAIEKKANEEKSLTKDDLTFLYEVDSPIQGFGYQKDPRIQELRSRRNPEEDMLVIFECTKDQIAHVPGEIRKNTKAYVGQLEPGIFQKLPDTLEHVYTSFPEKKIRRETIEFGGITAKQFEKAMTDAGMRISDYAKSMLESKDFRTSKTKEVANLVRLTVADLGFKGNATTDQIYRRAEELGLELCPAEVGPQYRLVNVDQPMDDWVFVGMKQIADSGGDPLVFRVGRNADGTWLYGNNARPTSEWRPGFRFLFRLRKSKT